MFNRCIQIKQFCELSINFSAKQQFCRQNTNFENDSYMVCLPLGGYDCLILDVYRADLRVVVSLSLVILCIRVVPQRGEVWGGKN